MWNTIFIMPPSGGFVVSREGFNIDLYWNEQRQPIFDQTGIVLPSYQSDGAFFGYPIDLE